MSKTQPICTHCPIRSLFSPSFSLTSTSRSKEPAIRGRSPSTQQPNRARSWFVPFPQPIVDHHHARGVSTALTTFRPPQSSPNGARERTCLCLLLLSLSARSAQLISVTVIKSLLGSFERVCARFVTSVCVVNVKPPDRRWPRLRQRSLIWICFGLVNVARNSPRRTRRRRRNLVVTSLSGPALCLECQRREWTERFLSFFFLGCFPLSCIACVVWCDTCTYGDNGRR